VNTLASAVVSPSPVAEVAQCARHRIARRLLPFLFILYVIAFLDRMNIGTAALQMPHELGFSEQVIGLGAGIFFLGYFLLEIPGALIVEHWSTRRWIARIMISWGVLTIFMAFIHTSGQFYLVRFLVGAAEAGFLPGVIVYLTHRFRYNDRAKAVAFFYAANPLSYVIGSPLAGLLLGLSWLGLRGWRWLFIIEGTPAIVFGFIAIWHLTDWPEQGRLATRRREVLDCERAKAREGSQREVLSDMGSFAASGCDSANAVLLLRHDGKLRGCVLAAHDFEAALRQYLVNRTHSFSAGLLYLVASLLASGLLMLAVGRRAAVGEDRAVVA